MDGGVVGLPGVADRGVDGADGDVGPGADVAVDIVTDPLRRLLSRGRGGAMPDWLPLVSSWMISLWEYVVAVVSGTLNFR